MMTKQPFDHVVREHGATVLRVCRAVLGPVDADDAWSETFLSALRAWSALPPDANVQAWLVTIAHRKAIDITRARQRHPVPIADLPAHPVSEPAEDHALVRAIAALPGKQRQVVAYHYLADLPYDEVAAIVGGTSAAARRAGADGIKNLRGRLAVTEGVLQ